MEKRRHAAHNRNRVLLARLDYALLDYRRGGFGVTLALTAAVLCIIVCMNLTTRIVGTYGHCGTPALIASVDYTQTPVLMEAVCVTGWGIAVVSRYGVAIARCATLVAVGVWVMCYLYRVW